MPPTQIDRALRDSPRAVSTFPGLPAGQASGSESTPSRALNGAETTQARQQKPLDGRLLPTPGRESRAGHQNIQCIQLRTSKTTNKERLAKSARQSSRLLTQGLRSETSPTNAGTRWKPL